MLNILTPLDIIALLDELKKRNITLWGRNDTLGYFGDIQEKYKLLYCTFLLYVPISEKSFDKYYFLNSEMQITAAYYQVYTELFGKEPFNLAKAIYDYLEAGHLYGEDSSLFVMLESKQLMKNNNLKVSFFRCEEVEFMEDEVPMMTREQKRTYNLDSKNPDLLKVADSIQIDFEDKDFLDYTIDDFKKTLNKIENIVNKSKKLLQKAETIKK